MSKITRRSFVSGTVAAGSGLAFPLVLFNGRSPSSEIRVGVVGLRGRGRDHIAGFRRVPDVRVVALCDVDRRVLAAAANKLAGEGERVATHVDVRELLERDDVDVVSIATPNHWHALMTIWACQAGKDVYVEKPVSHNVWEGRQMVRAAEKYGRIVQTGTQIRSSRAIAEALSWVREGHLGEIELARGLCYKPRQSIGTVEGPQPVDAGIDYDLWTGPAPMKELRRKRLHYDWHWVFDYGNGDLGNQGVHQMDIARWALGESGLPPRVVSFGGRFAYDDDGNTPNTQILYGAYERAPLLFEVRGLPHDLEAQSGGWREGMDRYLDVAIGVIVHCQGGTLRIPSYSEAQAYDRDGRHLLSWKGGGDHYANFIEATKSRKPERLNAPIAEGHASSALCHVGNVSYLRGKEAHRLHVRKRLADLPFAGEAFDRVCSHLIANGVDLESDPLVVGPVLEIDPDSERFRGDELANLLLTRQYREPFVVPQQV